MVVRILSLRVCFYLKYWEKNSDWCDKKLNPTNKNSFRYQYKVQT